MSTEAGQNLRLAGQIETFLELSSALTLTEPEQRALLDLTAAELDSLRLFLAPAEGMDAAKLQRRIDYAVPLLRRMLVASLS
jgi:hypothetical protein